MNPTWNPAVASLPMSGIRKMFSMASGMKDVIHLSIGQPDFPTPKHIAEADMKAVSEDKTHYTMDWGLPELVAALAETYSRRSGRTLTPENFLVTCGASEAIFLSLTAVTRPGGEVIVIEPSFSLYQPLIGYAGATARRIVTRAENGYQPDAGEIIGAMNERTCAVILNSPGNPTGAVYPRETIGAVCREAARRGVTVISDEVYEEFILDEGLEYASALRHGPDLGGLMVANSVSKTYSMPGMRVGWVVSSPENIQVLRRYHIHTSTTTNTPAQWAVLAALKADQQCVADMVAEYRRRRDRIVALMSQTAHLQSYSPQGAFYIMPSLPEGVNAEAVAVKMLQETGVCVVPGGTFGASCANALRFSYAASMENIEKAFERIIPWFKKQSF
jgi:aminotransferase